MGSLEEFNALGGLEMLRKINKIFYDKVYAHPWIGQFFKEIKQETIESQQTDFMAQAMGGPQNYNGKLVLQAHKHMFITEDLFEVREQLLQEAFKEANASPELQARWNKIDNAFKKALIKNKITDCEVRFKTDEILAFPNPNPKKKAA